MKMFTKHTDYAIRALLQLGLNKENFTSARLISKNQKIPYSFLRQILQELIKNKIIESKEGISGGVKLITNPKNIKINDIIKIFQGDIELSECMFRKKICANRSTCVLRREIKRIENIVTNEFSKITIQTLLNKLKINN
jgi:Rrf2 family protein